jgi:hypothetical protein
MAETTPATTNASAGGVRPDRTFVNSVSGPMTGTK